MNLKTVTLILSIVVIICYIQCDFLIIRKLHLPPGVNIASDFRSKTDALGRRRSQRHQGIDITGPVGTEIIAIADGRVLLAEDESCWGPTIMIDHSSHKENPLIALYGHLDEMLVQENDFVKRGQLIGRLGDNAKHRKCVFGIRHLHLQLGREIQSKEKRNQYWGHKYFLKDGDRSLNPHRFWSDGQGKVTCFVPGRNYPEGKITWPIHCR